MERNHQKIGLVNLAMFLGLGVAGLAAAKYCQSSAGLAAVVFAGIGLLVSLVSWFQMRLESQERLEKIEYDELTRTAASETLFKRAGEGDALPAQRSREQFEKYFVPSFTVLLCALQGVGAWVLWKMLDQLSANADIGIRNPLVALGAFAFIFLVAFLFGKYSATAARLEKVRLLRPGAGYLLLLAYLALAVTVGIGVVEAGAARADHYVARGITVLLGIIAIETLVNLILEIYRPRMKGRVSRPIYESRLVGLAGTPEGLVSTAAHALDYQFGFKVSETWFYRFLERSLGWIILVQVVILLLSTCVVFIEPGEQGLIERFGRPLKQRAVLEAGPHLKWPWPVDKVYRFRTAELRTVNVGFVPDPARENDPVFLWTIPHYKEEFNLLVASRDTTPVGTNDSTGERSVPVNLLTLSIPIQYEISDVRAWAYNYDDSGKFLEEIATRAVVRHLAGADLAEIMTTSRDQAAAEILKRVQDEANTLQLGVNILFVGLQDIHPPTKIADAYQAVVSAQQEMEARVLQAEGEASATVALAGSEANTRVRAAQATALRRKSDATAVAGQFTNQVAAYLASPEVYRMRLYLDTLASSGTNARKYVIAPTNTSDVVQLNLEERIRQDLLNLTVGDRK
ncbi:MAG TPA: protease modulator HflK [Verrucomicrobiota bacterium]|nr:protease modulator HflK [Verrucomicrobiota bacterium]